MKKNLIALTAVLATASSASAIVIDGDLSDFTSDMIVYQDDGSGTGLFITDVRVTNDADFLYVNYNLSQSVFAGPLGVFTAFDVDKSYDTEGNPNTGFNFFGQGLGADAAFQGDFPFQPAGNGVTELFNANGQVIPASFFGGDGVSLGGLKTPTGDPLFGTFSNLFDAMDGTTVPSTGVEFALALNGTLGDGTPLFTFDQEFDILVGFDAGFSGSSVTTGSYTPVIPEPASLALLGMGGLTLIGRRRRA
ncbi:MAG: PEP-CTERM sorting domain-containing protein [Planctomycetota bacterium]